MGGEGGGGGGGGGGGDDEDLVVAAGRSVHWNEEIQGGGENRECEGVWEGEGEGVGRGGRKKEISDMERVEKKLREATVLVEQVLYLFVYSLFACVVYMMCVLACDCHIRTRSL